MDTHTQNGTYLLKRGYLVNLVTYIENVRNWESLFFSTIVGKVSPCFSFTNFCITPQSTCSNVNSTDHTPGNSETRLNVKLYDAVSHTLSSQSARRIAMLFAQCKLYILLTWCNDQTSCPKQFSLRPTWYRQCYL